MKAIYKSREGKDLIMNYYDSLLEKWPVPYEAKNIATRHGQTHVIACGDAAAPPLLLFHGSSTNSAMWMGDIGSYSEDFRVYAVDLIGEPGKSAETRPGLEGPAYNEWVEDIFAALKVKKASLIGISLGGWVALKYAAAKPDSIEKLILLCPSGVGSQKASFALRVLPLMFLGEWGLKRINRLVYGDLDLPDEVKEFSGLLARYYRPITGKIPLFSDDELRGLDMPTLLFVGGKDPLLNSRQTYDRLSRLLTRFQGYYLDDSGHVLTGLQEKILIFLKENPA